MSDAKDIVIGEEKVGEEEKVEELDSPYNEDIIAKIESEEKEEEKIEADVSILFTNPSVSELQRFIGELFEHGITTNNAKMLEWYKKSADNGNAKAQYMMYKNTFENWDETKKWLIKSADNGYAEAQFDYYQFCPSEENIKWLTLAAEQGHAKAMLRLAENYIELVEDIEQRKKAVYWIKKYIDASKSEEDVDDIMSSHYILSQWLHEGVITVKDDAQAFHHLTVAIAMLKSSEVQESDLQEVAKMYMFMGDMHFHGWGTPQDYKTAFHYYEQYCDFDTTGRAYFQMYLMYRDGLGKDIDTDYAYALLEKSAEKEYSEAEYLLAKSLIARIDKKYHGTVRVYHSAEENDKIEDLISSIISELENASRHDYVDACVLLGLVYWKFSERNEESAKYWLKAKELTKDNERADVNYYLGTLREEGVGIEMDYEEAIKLYCISLSKLTADHEIEELAGNGVENCLKSFEYEHDEIIRDYPKAYKCLQILAKHENLEAQFLLGWMCWNGHGTEQNKSQAFTWYYTSILNDKDDALKFMRNELRSYENEMMIFKFQQITEEKKSDEVVLLKNELEATQKHMEEMKKQMALLLETVGKIKEKQDAKDVLFESDKED